MKIQRALKTNQLTQRFGENAYFDYTKFGCLGHNGIDWGCYCGEPIYWDCYDCEGKVVAITDNATAGVGVDIITEDKDGIFKHTFWHFLHGGLVVKIGQVLSSGDLIGFGDSTGMSTGHHLHRQLKKQWKDAFGLYWNANQDNGFQGAIDITPYFTNEFIGGTMSSLTNQIAIISWKIKQLMAKVGVK